MRSVVRRAMGPLLRSLALWCCTAVTVSACARPVVTHTAPPVVVLPTVTPVLNVTAEPLAPLPAQPAPPSGTYWVRRLTRGINIASGVGQERAYSGEVACVPATIDRKANEITFTLGSFSFQLHEMGEHWTLGSPTLTHASPAFSLRENTHQEIDRLDESSDEDSPRASRRWPRRSACARG
ncbi:hypothetical protein [Polyangium sp. 15x6]|uniref:hypothetical protein n=1 Tax=Polyangium sp. 15x6 TaxID=3042687 RepID=UPI00249BDD91|nr:hypothetical protein [Polyangium sp. 15x6]MDI3283456.1 hypothetical protein [Polyangium sp. 15x6]